MLRFITFALLIVFAGPAAAQVTGALPPPHPKLKELVVVTGEVVRIGDLVDNAGSNAEVAVFRSPDLGYTGGVPLARVIEALSPYKIAALDTGGISEVVVTRLSRAITSKEIEARIASALARQYGFGDVKNLSITFDRDVRMIHVEQTATEELQVARLNVDQRTGRFNIALELSGSDTARRLPLRFSGTAVETVEAAVLVRALNRGEVVKPSDVALERRPKAELAGEFIGTETAIGAAAKRQLRSGVVLRATDLMKAEVIQRNESVTIAYEVPGVLLTVRGKALEAGAVGDVVGVLNLQSNRTVQATVTGPGRVSVAAMSLVPAATTASPPEPSNTARQNTE
jgi:flagella basal body P-ring formation protein FlgA